MSHGLTVPSFVIVRCHFNYNVTDNSCTHTHTHKSSELHTRGNSYTQGLTATHIRGNSYTDTQGVTATHKG